MGALRHPSILSLLVFNFYLPNTFFFKKLKFKMAALSSDDGVSAFYVSDIDRFFN